MASAGDSGETYGSIRNNTFGSNLSDNQCESEKSMFLSNMDPQKYGPSNEIHISGQSGDGLSSDFEDGEDDLIETLKHSCRKKPLNRVKFR
jgi:hypothetical protein